jgi:glycosyltransferase involved in cell wall biosynthesis
MKHSIQASFPETDSPHPIKILHLVPSLSSGGAERQLVNVVRATSKENFKHQVCVIGDSSFFGSYLRDAGIDVFELKIEEKHPFLEAAIAFRRLIKLLDPDIISSWLYDANIAARLASPFRKKTQLITCLQLADYEPEGIRYAGWNRAKVLGLKMIDKVTSLVARPQFVACSQFVQDSYRRNFGIPMRRTVTIYNAVEPHVLASDKSAPGRIRKELGLSATSFVFIHVGRLDPQKNHRNILKAFRKVADTIPDSYLLLVGVGSIETDLRDLARSLNLRERVRFLGRRNDVGDLLELADVFVFPSYFEGLPVALVEAMFKSLPCIASRIDVFQEVIIDGTTGILVDPNSPEDLADAMISLQADPDLRRSLGQKAFEKASNQFDISITVKRWEEFYTSITRD